MAVVTMITSQCGNQEACRETHSLRLTNVMYLVRYFTRAEVAEHDFADDAWIIVHGHVYNITPWVPSHPGGNIILAVRVHLIWRFLTASLACWQGCN